MSSTTLGRRVETTCPICKTTVPFGESVCTECGEDLTPLVLIDNLSDSYYNEGLRLANEGQTTRAIEQMLKALAFDQQHIPASVVLGKLYAQAGRYADAAAAWQQALTLDPHNASARAGLLKLESVQANASSGRRSRSWWPVALLTAGLLLATLALWRGWQPTDSAVTTSASIPAAVPIQTSVSTILPSPTLAPPDLAASVAASLRTDSELSGLDLDVRQDGRVVYIRGPVQTPDQKRRAERLAKSVAGVAAVDSTDLTIAPRLLAQQVEQALRAEPQLRSVAIAAQQVGDVIRLSGTVPAAGMRERAEVVAGAVSGVTLVDSRDLIVAAPPLADAVQQALRGDPQTAGLNLSVEQTGSAIKLSGRVPTLKARLDAESVARKAPGVELIDSSGVLVQPSVREIAVQPGDTLTGLAQQYYGDPAAWRVIYEANRLALSSPGLIRVGSRLILP